MIYCEACNKIKKLPHFREYICPDCKKKEEDKKIEKHLKYLAIAKIYSSMSHCVSHQVGAILVKEGRIIATGMNGTPSKYPNCDEIFVDYCKETERQTHMEFSDKYEIHAEQNILILAARKGICVEGSILYCTTQPCWQCLKMIISAGIKEIYFSDLYDRINLDQKWWEFARATKVKVQHLQGV